MYPIKSNKKYQKKREKIRKSRGNYKVLGHSGAPNFSLAASFLCTSHHLRTRLSFWFLARSNPFFLTLSPPLPTFSSPILIFRHSFNLLYLELRPTPAIPSPSCHSQSCMTLRNGRAAAPTFFADDPFPLRNSTPFPFSLSIATLDVGNGLVNAVASTDHREGQQCPPL
jgi:hypothetical protein